MTDETKPERNADLPLLISAMDERRNTLFNTGGWYSVSKDKFAGHFFVAAREDADLAISMCFSVVAPIDKLHAVVEGKRCMTCALYEAAGGGEKFQETQERRRKHVERALQIRADTEARKAEQKSKTPTTKTKE